MKAGVAQWGEQGFRKSLVGGSSPPVGSNFEWTIPPHPVLTERFSTWKLRHEVMCESPVRWFTYWRCNASGNSLWECEGCGERRRCCDEKAEG